MALGTNIGMSPNGVHGRVIMVDSRYGFRAVALTACDAGSHGVEIPRLSRVALDAGGSIIEFESPVGVRQVGANTHRGSRSADRETVPPDPGCLQDSPGTTGTDFIAFIVPGCHPLAIPVDFRSDLFLCPRRYGRDSQKYGCPDQESERSPMISQTNYSHSPFHAHSPITFLMSPLGDELKKATAYLSLSTLLKSRPDPRGVCLCDDGSCCRHSAFCRHSLPLNFPVET